MASFVLEPVWRESRLFWKTSCPPCPATEEVFLARAPRPEPFTKGEPALQGVAHYSNMPHAEVTLAAYLTKSPGSLTLNALISRPRLTVTVTSSPAAWWIRARNASRPLSAGTGTNRSCSRCATERA